MNKVILEGDLVKIKLPYQDIRVTPGMRKYDGQEAVIFEGCGMPDGELVLSAPLTYRGCLSMKGGLMILKTFSANGPSQIVLDDDATDADIYQAMYLDGTEEHGNGKGKPRKISGSKKEVENG